MLLVAMWFSAVIECEWFVSHFFNRISQRGVFFNWYREILSRTKQSSCLIIRQRTRPWIYNLRSQKHYENSPDLSSSFSNFGMQYYCLSKTFSAKHYVTSNWLSWSPLQVLFQLPKPFESSSCPKRFQKDQGHCKCVIFLSFVSLHISPLFL